MRFNQILIVDSIPNGELNTARRLHDDIQIAAAAHAPAPDIVFRRVEGAQQFVDLLNELCVEAEAESTPVLHLECHGGQAGVQFADRSILGWADLKPHLVALNRATRLSLLAVVSACEGSAITRTIGVTDHSPLWGLIGPTRPMFPLELEGSFLQFYSTLLRTKSASEALDALRAHMPGAFVFRNAEFMFQYVWEHYQANHETLEALRPRAEQMRNDIQALGLLPPTTDQIIALFRARNREFFDRFRRAFFMCDLFPDHDARFKVDYVPPPDAAVPA